MRSACGLLLLVFCGASRASADCGVDTLANYVALGGAGCTLAGFTVKDFSYSLIASTVVISDSDITVTPFSFGDTVGLTFSSTAFTVSGTDFATYLLAYTWDPGDIRSLDDILNTDPPVAPGIATITTDACVDAAFIGAFCPTSTVTLTVFDDGVAPDLFDTVAFSPTIGTLGIRNTIDLQANGAVAEFDYFTNQIHTPEPNSFVLLGAAIGFSAVLLRRRSRRL